MGRPDGTGPEGKTPRAGPPVPCGGAHGDPARVLRDWQTECCLTPFEPGDEVGRPLLLGAPDMPGCDRHGLLTDVAGPVEEVGGVRLLREGAGLTVALAVDPGDEQDRRPAPGEHSRAVGLLRVERHGAEWPETAGRVRSVRVLTQACAESAPGSRDRQPVEGRRRLPVDRCPRWFADDGPVGRGLRWREGGVLVVLEVAGGGCWWSWRWREGGAGGPGGGGRGACWWSWRCRQGLPALPPRPRGPCHPPSGGRTRRGDRGAARGGTGGPAGEAEHDGRPGAEPAPAPARRACFMKACAVRPSRTPPPTPPPKARRAVNRRDPPRSHRRQWTPCATASSAPPRRSAPTARPSRSAGRGFAPC
ncbi:DUF6578 domain-containing protein [Streptomyces sp. NPDC058741]|uniref:DUF6578 domain-containing protein n=1 Tax=Streptomyces sp. NPDC058741 TaxID=3346620 RepID=UPI0036B1615F